MPFNVLFCLYSACMLALLLWISVQMRKTTALADTVLFAAVGIAWAWLLSKVVIYLAGRIVQ